jgi:hypothetical protein
MLEYIPQQFIIITYSANLYLYIILEFGGKKLNEDSEENTDVRFIICPCLTESDESPVYECTVHIS